MSYSLGLPMRLRELRIKKHLTQLQLAEELNLSESFIRGLEAGNKSLSVNTLVKMCNFFEVRSDDLLADEILVDADILANEFTKELEGLTISNRKVAVESMKGVCRALAALEAEQQTEEQDY